MQDPSPPGSPQTPPPQDPNARTWCIVAHVTAFAGLIIPLGNILGPLVVWLFKRFDDPTIDEHAKESLNFQISMTIYTLIAGVLILALVGFILMPALVIANIVLVIVAAIKASNGEPWRYPVTIRMVQ